MMAEILQVKLQLRLYHLLRSVFVKHGQHSLNDYRFDKRLTDCVALPWLCNLSFEVFYRFFNSCYMLCSLMAL
jgi:hypothetical protein